ncbi:MAG: hypothetical protein M0R22_00920 [Dehalococcoidia bacterium]|jgi:hypothetical protein|nr:hypothetical protein [Dehalococcoidia bacterium]
MNAPVVVACPQCDKLLSIAVATDMPYHSLCRAECRFCGSAFALEYWAEVKGFTRDESALAEREKGGKT